MCNLRHSTYNLRTSRYTIELYDIVCPENTISYVDVVRLNVRYCTRPNAWYRTSTLVLYDIVRPTYDIVGRQESRWLGRVDHAVAGLTLIRSTRFKPICSWSCRGFKQSNKDASSTSYLPPSNPTHVCCFSVHQPQQPFARLTSSPLTAVCGGSQSLSPFHISTTTV